MQVKESYFQGSWPPCSKDPKHEAPTSGYPAGAYHAKSPVPLREQNKRKPKHDVWTPTHPHATPPSSLSLAGAPLEGTGQYH